MKFITQPDNKIVEVLLPQTPSKIGVMVSGGADSAVLLYIVAMINANIGNIHTITTFTVPRDDGAYLYSPGVVDFVNRKLNLSLNVPHVVGNKNLPHSKQTRSGANEALEKYSMDTIFYGSQSVPPDSVTMPGIYPWRPTQIYYDKSICPFAEVDKRNTLDLYRQLGLEDLLKITHSCTETTVGRCNQCFNCTERAWALKELGMIDPGSM